MSKYQEWSGWSDCLKWIDAMSYPNKLTFFPLNLNTENNMSNMSSMSNVNNMNNTEELERLLQKAETEAKRLREELEAAKRKPAKWNPKIGNYYIYGGGSVQTGSPLEHWAVAGSEYPTLEAADAANRRIVFFRRLCAPATELNPSGKVTGTLGHCVTLGTTWDNWRPSHLPMGFIDCVFETELAAKQAAEIMNRDGWTPENGGGSFEE